MKLYQLLQAFDFGELFPEICKMYPNAKLHADTFEHAFNLLCNMRPVNGKKTIRYQVMNDPDSGEIFYGADDSNFATTWEACLGKEVKRESGVDLNDTEMVANCLLNLLFIAKHPQAFDIEYRKLMR